jgi:hypothetical protein
MSREGGREGASQATPQKEVNLVHGSSKEVSLLVQKGSFPGIPSVHCWTSPLTYYLGKIRYSEELERQ